MALTLSDIRQNLREFFLGKDTRTEDAALEAANAAIQAGNVVNGDVVPSTPSVYIPKVPNFDNQSVEITEVPQIAQVPTIGNPALQAADAALQAAKSTAAFNPAVSAAQVATDAAQQVIAGVPISGNAAPVLQEVQSIETAPIIQNQAPIAAPVEADVSTVFTPPATLPATGIPNLPEKNNLGDEVTSFTDGLLSLITGVGSSVKKSVERANVPYEKTPLGEFGFPQEDSLVTFGKHNRSYNTIGELFSKLNTLNYDKEQQQKALDQGLADLGYTGPTKNIQEFNDFFRKQSDFLGKSPVQSKDQVDELAKTFGVTYNTAKTYNNANNDFEAKATTKLENKLYKLDDQSGKTSIFQKAETTYRIDIIKNQLSSKVNRWNSSVTSLQLYKERAELEGQDTTFLDSKIGQAIELRDIYTDRYSQIILWGQQGALASGEEDGPKAAKEGAKYVAKKLAEGGYVSVNDYMNKGATVINENFSPDNNLQLLTAVGALDAANTTGDIIKENIYQTRYRAGVYLNEFFKGVQKQNARDFIEANDPKNKNNLNVQIKNSPLSVNQYNIFGVGRTALEGASDLPIFRNTLSKEGIGTVRRQLDAGLQNAPEIVEVATLAYASSVIGGASTLGYTAGASKTAQSATAFYNVLARNTLPNLVINTIADASQPFTTGNKGLANDIVGIITDPEVLAAPFRIAGGFAGGVIGKSIEYDIISAARRLSNDGFKDVAAFRSAWDTLSKDSKFLDLPEAEQLNKAEALAQKTKPTISEDAVDEVNRYARRLEGAIYAAAKRDPALANQIAKATFAQGELSKGVKQIISGAGGLTDNAKQEIAKLQTYLNTFAGDDNVNVADMIRSIYGIDAPVFYGGFYSGVKEINNLQKFPEAGIADIKYTIPKQVYDTIQQKTFDPDNITLVQVDKLRAISPDIATVVEDGAVKLDEASKQALGIYETKTYALGKSGGLATDAIVDDLIAKNIIPESTRPAATRNAELVNRVLNKILCP